MPAQIVAQISLKGGAATGRIEPKTLVYFRHAATNANQVDADKLDFARCETQRNLSGDGRRMARDIGREPATVEQARRLLTLDEPW